MCQLLGVSARLPGNATRKLCVGDDYYLRFSGLALDEMLTDGEQRELETIGDVKLVVNPRQVMLHRLLTEREPLRHFLVAAVDFHRQRQRGSRWCLNGRGVIRAKQDR